MNSIFVRIYGGMIAACCLIALTVYVSIQVTNYFRLMIYRAELAAGPMSLIAYMASREPIPMNIEEMSKGIKNIYTNATAVNAALTAGGLGGMIGGGVANLAGIPLRQPAKTSENVKEYLAQLQMENDMMQSGEAMYA